MNGAGQGGGSKKTRRRRRRRRRRQERGAVRRPNCTTASDLLQGPCLALGRQPASRAAGRLAHPSAMVQGAPGTLTHPIRSGNCGPSGVARSLPSRPQWASNDARHRFHPWMSLAPVGGGTGGGTPFQVGSPPSSPSPPTKLGTLEPALAVGPESPPRGGPDGKPPLPTVALVLQFEPLPGMEQLRAGQASAHLMNLKG